jgi:hypothetical protein
LTNDFYHHERITTLWEPDPEKPTKHWPAQNARCPQREPVDGGRPTATDGWNKAPSAGTNPSPRPHVAHEHPTA